MSRVLAVDLGSTYFKCGLVDVLPDGSALVRNVMRHRVDMALWSHSDSALAFRRAVARIVNDIQVLLAEGRPDAVSLCGVREGVAISNSQGVLEGVATNATSLRLQAEHGEAWLQQLTLHAAADRPVVASLQGWLAFVLTGRLAITNCELDAWCVRPVASGRASHEPSLGKAISPEVVPIGREIGCVKASPMTPVVLAGTDEMASHLGAGLGRAWHTELGAGTYWSLSRPTSTAERGCPPHIRLIPAAPPYPAVASYVGYQWGRWVAELAAGRRPAVPSPLPAWAEGSGFIDALRNGRCASIEEAAALMASDLVQASQVLPRPVDDLAPIEVVVHGGGAEAGGVAHQVVKAAGWRAHYLEHDPTIAGAALAFVSSQGGR